MANLNDYIKLYPRQLEAYKLIGSGKIIFYGGSRGGGKAMSLKNKVLTPFGFKLMGDIKAGDMVSNPDGSISNVIGVYPQGVQKVYKLKTIDGGECLCTADHLWLARVTCRKKKMDGRYYPFAESDKSEFKIYTTQMLIDELAVDNSRNILIPLSKPIEFTKSYRYPDGVWAVEPYLLGVLLGDGCLRGNNVSVASEDVQTIEYFKGLYGEDLVIRPKENHSSLSVTGESRKSLVDDLTKIGVYGKLAKDKFIPESYKVAPSRIRYAVIQGLMDTDGSADDRGHLEFTTVSPQLADDVQWIIRSLGGKATMSTKIGKYRDKDGDIVECQKVYRLYINIPDGKNLFRLERKRARCVGEFNGGVSILKRRVISIEPAGEEECQCIAVSNPNGLYITDDFIVTHNTHLERSSMISACLQFKKLRCLVMRRHYDELEQLFVSRFLIDYPAEVFGYTYNKKEKTAIFPNGSRIVFRAAKTMDDARKHLGIEYHFIAIDEANQFEEEVFTFIRGSLRNAGENDFIPTLLMTGNPGGISDQWFKDRFISPNKAKWTKEEKEHEGMFVYIPSKVYDNPSLTQSGHYVSMLESLPENYRKAWLEGDWDVFQGQFFEEWNPKVHVVEPFAIPDTWERVAGLDIGGTKAHPTVLLKIAQDPETLDLYVYEEYSDYGSIEKYIYNIKELLLGDDISLIYTDPSAFGSNVKLRESDQSAARMFGSEGIPLQRANNDRINGWRCVKAWMHWTTRSGSKLKIFDTCDGLIKTIPTLKYTPRATKLTEDLDTEMADDYVDALRYALISGFQFPTQSLLTENQKVERVKKAGVYTKLELLDRFATLKPLPYSGRVGKIEYEPGGKVSWV